MEYQGKASETYITTLNLHISRLSKDGLTLRFFFRSGIVERKEHAGEFENRDVKRDAHVRRRLFADNNKTDKQ